MDAELPVPMQHAWLVNADNKIIDPTWRDVADNLYFGTVFETKFVLDLLQIKKSAGILIDLAAMRRHYGTTELFESGIHRLATTRSVRCFQAGAQQISRAGLERENFPLGFVDPDSV